MRFWPTQSSLLRRTFLAVGIAGTLVLATAATLYAARATLLHRAILYFARNAGIHKPALAVDWRTPSRLVLENITIGEDIRIGAVTLDMGKALLDGRLDALTVSQPSIRLHKKQTGWSVSGFGFGKTPTEPKATNTRAQPLEKTVFGFSPVAKATIEQADIEVIAYGHTILNASFDATATHNAQSLKADISTTVSGPLYNCDLVSKLDLLRDGTVTASVVSHKQDIRNSYYSVSNTKPFVAELSGTLDGPETLTAIIDSGFHISFPQLPGRPEGTALVLLETGTNKATLDVNISSVFGKADNRIVFNTSNLLQWIAGKKPLAATFTHSGTVLNSAYFPAKILQYRLELPFALGLQNTVDIAPAAGRLTIEKYEDNIQKIIEPLDLRITANNNAKAAATLDTKTGHTTLTASLTPFKNRFSVHHQSHGRLVASHGLFADFDLVRKTGSPLHINHASIRLPALVMPTTGFSMFGFKGGISPCDKGGKMYCINLKAEKLEHKAKPALFTPLQASVDIAPQSQNNYAIKGHVSGTNHALAIEFEGTHNTKTARGTLTTTLLPTEFGNKKGMTRLAAISPLAAQTIELDEGFVMAAVQTAWNGADIEGSAELMAQKLKPDLKAIAKDAQASLGQIAASLDFIVESGKPAGNGEVLFENINLSTSDKKLKNINGVLEIESLFPFALKPAQKLSVELASVGLPLTSGQASFTLTPNESLSVWPKSY